MNFTEQTILSPIDTQLSFEAKILDADYVREPNRYGEYILEFQPLTSTDEQRFQEMGEQAMMTVERHKQQYSRKEPNLKIFSRAKFPMATQLFPAKINDKDLHPDFMYHRDVSLKGHFRDLPNGDIVFNIDYIDFYQVETMEERLARQWNEGKNEPCDIDW